MKLLVQSAPRGERVRGGGSLEREDYWIKMRSETRTLGVGEIREEAGPQDEKEMNRSRVLLSPLNYQFILGFESGYTGKQAWFNEIHTRPIN